MELSITFHLPWKVKYIQTDKGLLIYMNGMKKWFFNFGGIHKQKWIRIFGFTFCISYWKTFPLEIRLTIQ